MPSLLDNVKRIVPITAVGTHSTFRLLCPIELRSLLRAKKGETSTSLTVTRWQLPLRSCWAVTIHKTQGLTCHNGLSVHLESAKSWPGGAYVAVSRVCRLRDLFISGDRLNMTHFKSDIRLIKEYERLKALANKLESDNAELESPTSTMTTPPPLLSSNVYGVQVSGNPYG